VYGVSYGGTFYARSRTLATFGYAADGCEALQLTVGASTQATMIMGRAALATPVLAAAVADATRVVRHDGVVAGERAGEPGEAGAVHRRANQQ
jgi:hypothetical protein